MTRLAWLTICTLPILSCTQLIADENQDGRHFNINPGNMMNGMMNPMRNMFGGSNRDRGLYNDYYYNDYQYYGPQAYPIHPPEYGYPGSAYGQPPAGYGAVPRGTYYPSNPGYQPQPQATPPSQTYSEPTNPNRYRPPVEAPTAAPAYPSSPQEQFQFRPLDNQASVPEQGQYAPTPYREPTSSLPAGPQALPGNRQPEPMAPLSYPPQYNQQPATPSYPAGAPNASAGYMPQNETAAPAEPAMKFRPLDKPGYSQ